MPTVLVYWYPGRDSEQKQKIAQRMTDALIEDGNAKREIDPYYLPGYYSRQRRAGRTLAIAAPASAISPLMIRPPRPRIT